MKKSIIYLFPVGSIISIIVASIFPIVRLEDFSPFWIWGFPVFEWGVVHLLDIPLKTIFSIIVALMVILTSSIFLLRKHPDRLKIISNIWFWSGIGIIILTFLWILSWNFVVPFFAYPSSTFEFIIVLPFIGGILLIFGKIYTYIFSRKTKE